MHSMRNTSRWSVLRDVCKNRDSTGSGSGEKIGSSTSSSLSKNAFPGHSVVVPSGSQVPLEVCDGVVECREGTEYAEWLKLLLISYCCNRARGCARGGVVRHRSHALVKVNVETAEARAFVARAVTEGIARVEDGEKEGGERWLLNLLVFGNHSDSGSNLNLNLNCMWCKADLTCSFAVKEVRFQQGQGGRTVRFRECHNKFDRDSITTNLVTGVDNTGQSEYREPTALLLLLLACLRVPSRNSSRSSF